MKKKKRRSADIAGVEVRCGYCRERWTVFIDPTAATTQSYVEDCQVCCRPNRLDISVDNDDGAVSVTASFEG